MYTYIYIYIYIHIYCVVLSCSFSVCSCPAVPCSSMSAAWHRPVPKWKLYTQREGCTSSLIIIKHIIMQNLLA